MLQELRIVNFAIIDDIDIEFKPNLNGLVGETGAGKSIIVDALSLLSGSRSSFNKLRDESKKAFIEGVFHFSEVFIAQHRILNDYIDENNSLVVSRSLLPSKSSLIRINGETVSLKVLKDVMAGVIDIHSQNDSSYLLQSAHHLGLLDTFLGTEQAKLLDEYAAKFDQMKKKRLEKENFKQSNDINQREFLEFQINEIEKYEISENEIEDLEQELKDLSGFARVQEAFKSLQEFLRSGESGSLVSDVLEEVEMHAKSLYGSPLEEAGENIAEKASDLEMALNEATDAYESLDYSPQRLEEINQRLFSLSTLQHKYGKTTREIFKAYNDFKEKLDLLYQYNDRLKQFDKEIAAIAVELDKLGDRLTSNRKEGARRLTESINSELQSLGLLKDGFRVDMQKAGLSKTGKDNLKFEVCLNKGSKFMELKEAASGGESSRLMLALKTVLNKTSPYDILIFDEIDSGISGNVAFKAANKMLSIADNSMVIVISHLPQVVAACNHTYLVYKDVEGGITQSHIKPLSNEEKIDEVGKMLSGNKLTKGGVDAAKELIHQYTK